MFASYAPSYSQPANSRRRPPNPGRNTGYSQHDSDEDYATGNLELSAHWPRSPYNNRYDLLAPTPPHTTSRDRDSRTHRPQRRGPNSRGSKEGKRRRDARRTERKWAAFLLDEQFSLQVDETLKRANIQPLPAQHSSSSFSPAANTSRLQNALVRYTPPPSPPQIPAFGFSRFEVRDFAHLTSPDVASVPSWRQKSAQIPSWCPPIPCIQRHHASPEELPTFFDLSSLPEPKEIATPAKPCQALQLWRGSGVLSAPKQSRFFPSAPSTPIVKLPRTSCKLHESDCGSHNLEAYECVSIPERLASNGISEEAEKGDAAGGYQPEGVNLPTAANLWQILSDTQDGQQEPEERLRNHTIQSSRSNEDMIPAVDDAQVSELDGKEIPYVHANSLTGYANELATYHANGTLSDSVALMAAAFISAAEGVLGQHDDSTLELCDASTQTEQQRPRSTLDTYFSAELPEAYLPLPDVDDSSLTVSEDADTAIDAHYTSEQELFKAPETPNPSDSLCDLETFLKMGHVENCWCRDCGEAPTLVEEDTLTEDDGWMVWSTIDNGSASTPASETGTCNEEINTPPLPSKDNPSWDDMFPRLPSRSPQKAEDADFEDADFDDLNGEYDWCWNF